MRDFKAVYFNLFHKILKCEVLQNQKGPSTSSSSNPLFTNSNTSSSSPGAGPCFPVSLPLTFLSLESLTDLSDLRQLPVWSPQAAYFQIPLGSNPIKQHQVHRDNHPWPGGTSILLSLGLQTHALLGWTSFQCLTKHSVQGLVSPRP